MRERELKQLIEAAKRTKAMDFEWTAEVCRLLLRSGGANEEARSMVAKIVEEVVEEFRRRVEQWRAVSFDYEEVWPLYERLLADKAAVQRLCDELRAVKAKELAVKRLPR